MVPRYVLQLSFEKNHKIAKKNQQPLKLDKKISRDLEYLEF